MLPQAAKAGNTEPKLEGFNPAIFDDDKKDWFAALLVVTKHPYQFGTSRYFARCSQAVTTLEEARKLGYAMSKTDYPESKIFIITGNPAKRATSSSEQFVIDTGPQANTSTRRNDPCLKIYAFV